MGSISNKAAIVGIGHSDYRALYGPPGVCHRADLLAVDALKAAVVDAGLQLSDIDGLLSSGVTETPSGYGQFAYRAGLREVRYLVPMLQSGRQGQAILWQAAMAIEAGLADHVACVFSIAARSAGNRFAGHKGDLYDDAFGMASPGAQYAMLWSRYLHEHGYSGREELQATVPLAFRRHAALNPHATMQDPLTREDYLASPYVARPLRRLDYCLVNDGAVCVIVTRADRARDLARPPVLLTAHAYRASLWETYVPPVGPQACYQSYARSMMTDVLAEAGIERRDIGGLQVYDNFTPDVVWSIEGAGFCEHGEGLDWIQDGRIELGGELPVNTGGGMMSEAYMMGWNNYVEAVRQLRGEAGPRQIADCRHQLAITLAGLSSMLILSRGDQT